MGVKLGSRLQLAIGTIPEGGLNEARPVSKVALLEASTTYNFRTIV